MGSMSLNGICVAFSRASVTARPGREEETMRKDIHWAWRSFWRGLLVSHCRGARRIEIRPEPAETRQRAAAALADLNRVRGVLLVRPEPAEALRVQEAADLPGVAEPVLEEADHKLAQQSDRSSRCATKLKRARSCARPT